MTKPAIHYVWTITPCSEVIWALDDGHDCERGPILTDCWRCSNLIYTTQVV